MLVRLFVFFINFTLLPSLLNAFRHSPNQSPPLETRLRALYPDNIFELIGFSIERRRRVACLGGPSCLSHFYPSLRGFCLPLVSGLVKGNARRPSSLCMETAHM